ncbi:hypothetical protein D9756_011161 [Leucocoprinus leucothites]|uniref:DUF3533 domain-containing protein n=1 Tax=Leucocoprinus leucothites TaxID=201217 RepID=A0A8H5CNG2_9AGAR|nr:hypothetical protein D9756_011161 [Leucoagaricus leucothites]
MEPIQEQYELNLGQQPHLNPTANSSTQTIGRSFDYAPSEHVVKLETGASEAASRPEWKIDGSNFLARTEAMANARKIYVKTFVGGMFCVILTIFAVFSIYWGSLWKIPAHPLNGWVVDFDGGEVGQFLTQQIMASSNKAIAWSTYAGSEIGSLEQLQDDVVEEKTWVAIAINSGASSRLSDALQNPSAAYNGSSVITVYGAEARNENGYRSMVSPTTSSILNEVSLQFALQFAQRVSSTQSSSLANIISTSPQLLVSPVHYTMINLRPFDEPVASAATFVGLIYLLILSFYIVMIGDGARNASGMTRLLSYGGMVRLRLISSVVAYFFLSLFYSLVNVAFQIDFTRKFGHAGFVVFWMVNWAGMMAVGLALESLVTILTTRFIPFFMIFWIISNVSVSVYPIEVLPRIFRYGYAAPFYNVSHAFRTIAFNTKNQLGLNFGVLIAWIAISCITLPVFQWMMWPKKLKNNASHRTQHRTTKEPRLPVLAALHIHPVQMASEELAATYAALILADDGLEITSDKILATTNAAGFELEPIWASLLAKALEGKNVKDLLSNVGSGGGAPAAAAPTGGAGAGGAAAAEAPKEEKKEEKEEESDDDMVRLPPPLSSAEA